MTTTSAQPDAPAANWFQGIDEREAVAAIRGLVLRTMGSLSALTQFDCFSPASH